MFKQQDWFYSQQLLIYLKPQRVFGSQNMNGLSQGSSLSNISAIQKLDASRKLNKHQYQACFHTQKELEG